MSQKFCVIIPGLSDRMRTAGATNLSLEQASGVCYRTIANARAEKPIIWKNALCIIEALTTRKFKRDPRGAR
jgi:hypothetical protein